MISSIGNTISALNAYGTGLNVKANNIANADSENFKKSRAVYVEGENGDVIAEISKVGLESELLSFSGAEAVTEAQPSNVELAEEIPGMMIDQKGFEANLSVIKTKDEMLGSILDIIA
ncbi:MAG: flagellar biosynthesis protein FlgC [Deltaproteobacteria bacterium]|nr:flagellar biosynthesis protein FlgC [Deltaproteobacteria bacterium]